MENNVMNEVMENVNENVEEVAEGLNKDGCSTKEAVIGLVMGYAIGRTVEAGLKFGIKKIKKPVSNLKDKVVGKVKKSKEDETNEPVKEINEPKEETNK